MSLLRLIFVFAGPFYLAQLAQAAAYQPTYEYSGATFFDRWAYYGNVDNTTWGNVTFLDRDDATKDRLTFINDAGNAIVQVDNTTTLLPGPLVNRNSIRLTSVDTYSWGSLVIIDVLHIPYGCSVWPSFWTFGIGPEWPAGGEIDVIESINGLSNNQVALHTTEGCFQVDNPVQTGNTIEKDCSTPKGCVIAETQPDSFGPGFAEAGGGVWALQMETTGIYVWFWGRNNVPANIQTATSSTPMDTSTWGTPTAAYPAGPSCSNMTSFFTPQQLVLLTTLCGVWAGVPDIYQQTCHTPTGSCFADNVLGPPSNFDQAYWEVKYIRTYQFGETPTSSTNLPIITTTADSSSPTKAAVTTPKSSGSDTSTFTISCGLIFISVLVVDTLLVWTF